MNEEFLTFKKFNDEGLASELAALFDEHGIKYNIENDKVFNLASIGNEEFNQEFCVKIREVDFPKADELLLELSRQQLDTVQKDYYLFNFTDEELIEIITKPDEWGQFDYLLAQKLLKERGKEINPEVAKVLKHQRLNELAKPEESKRSWIVAGYIMALLGGLLGIFIGYHLMTFKKTLPSGDRVYAYRLKDRNNGGYIMIIGIAALIIGMAYEVIKIASK